MQPKYRGNGTPERTGSLSFFGTPYRVDADSYTASPDRTSRDVVAQTLDYGSWVKDLSLEELEQIYVDFGGGETHLDEAFAEHFGGALADVVNAEQQFTIVAAELDATSDRIIEFPAESYDVAINAVFFGHFADGGREYLARTWLLDPHQVEDKAARPSRRKRRPLTTFQRRSVRNACAASRSDKPSKDANTNTVATAPLALAGRDVVANTTSALVDSGPSTSALPAAATDGRR